MHNQNQAKTNIIYEAREHLFLLHPLNAVVIAKPHANSNLVLSGEWVENPTLLDQPVIYRATIICEFEGRTGLTEKVGSIKMVKHGGGNAHTHTPKSNARQNISYEPHMSSRY